MIFTPVGGKSTGNTAGMLGFQDPTPDDPSSSQVGSKQPDSIIPGMPNFEPSDATKPQRRASRRRHSVRSKQNAKSGDGQDTTKTPEEERSASGRQLIWNFIVLNRVATSGDSAALLSGDRTGLCCAGSA